MITTTIPVAPVIVAFMTKDKTLFSRFLSSKCFVVINKYSMGIFLLHYIVLETAGKTLCEFDYSAYLLSVILVSIFVLTLFISFIIEKLYFRMKNRVFFV